MQTAYAAHPNAPRIRNLGDLAARLEPLATAEYWSEAVAQIGPRIRKTRRLHRVLSRRFLTRLATRPEMAKPIAAGAAVVWLLGAFLFGGVWFALTAMGALWAFYAAQPPHPAWD